MTRCGWLYVTALVLWVVTWALVVAAAVNVVRAHDIYGSWKMRNGISCCDNTDCRPTNARVNDKGQWEAWDGVDWVPIPQNAMLPPDLAGDGRSHYCGKRYGTMPIPYCFSPGQIRG